MSGSNILFILTGSIAAYKACDAVSQLVQRGHRVRTVATESALKFIGATTLEGLTGTPVRSDLFAPGVALEHINLTRWAEAVIVCPATAHTLACLAAGLADDLPGALFLAHDRTKPWLVAPAMNPAMWAHPATQASVAKLREWGVRFLPVGAGRTSCGETGEGRLAEPDLIVASIEAALARPVRPLRVLITSGGTAEPIDGVRVLTNISTGGTGAGLAEHLVRCGHNVLLLRARTSAPGPSLAREETFGTFAELEAALTRALGDEHFDAVIHAAAVGDFSMASVTTRGVEQSPGTKLDSRFPHLLGLKPQPKLVDGLRGLSRNPTLAVVAFKLTDGAAPAAIAADVAELFTRAGVDWVVHNDLAARGESPEVFPADVHARRGGPAVHCLTRQALAVTLEKLLTLSPATPA